MTSVDGRIVHGDVDAALCEALLADGIISCDIETSGLDFRNDKIGTVQVSSASAGSFIVQVGAEKPQRLLSLIENDQIVKVFHHATFDVRFMVAQWDCKPTRIACTKIASKLAEPGRESRDHSLKPLLDRYLGVSLDKSQQVSDWTSTFLSTSQVDYALNDVRFLLPLYAELTRDLERKGLLGTYASCLAFLPTRAALDVGGWPDVFLY